MPFIVLLRQLDNYSWSFLAIKTECIPNTFCSNTY